MALCMIDLVRYLRPKGMTCSSIIHGQFLVVDGLPLTFGHVLATM
jgi:hypothetical protein